MDLRLQYQMSTGRWTDAGDQTEEFLVRCMRYNGPDTGGEVVPRFRATRDLTRDEAIVALLAGRQLRNDPEDWYSNCRCGNTYEATMAAREAAAPPVRMVKCSCGHTVRHASAMNASLGTSCPDCYDRMSA